MATKHRESPPPAGIEFAIGQCFEYETQRHWSGNYGQSAGTQIDYVRIRITGLFANRFDYTVDDVIHISNPCPGDGFRCSTRGGIAYDYARELLASGALVAVTR